MKVTHYNIKQQGACFQSIGPTEIQSNTRCPKCLQLLKSGWHTSPTSKYSWSTFSKVKSKCSQERIWDRHVPIANHTEDQQKLPKPSLPSPTVGASPTMWKTTSLPWEPLEWELGGNFTLQQDFSRASPYLFIGSLQQYWPETLWGSHFPTGWPVTQHFFKSPS